MQVFGSCEPGALRICVEGSDDVVRHISYEDISHVKYDIASVNSIVTRLVCSLVSGVRFG